MAKYKVGDKVKVKDYPIDVGPGWVMGMDEMLGKIVKIREVMPSGEYRIEGSYYAWCDEMFEDMVQTTGNEIIDLLMKKLGVEIDEEFEIIGSIYSPYKITEKAETPAPLARAGNGRHRAGNGSSAPAAGTLRKIASKQLQPLFRFYRAVLMLCISTVWQIDRQSMFCNHSVT